MSNKAKSTSDPELCYCLASRCTARVVTRIYERHLEAVQITSTQFTILAILEFWSELTVFDLAEKMGMERTTLVRTIKPMKEAGLIVEGKEKLRRALKLKLSTKGLNKLEQSQPYWLSAQQEFEALVGLSTAEKLLEIKRDIAAAVDQR